jgi:hypothetical protein
VPKEKDLKKKKDERPENKIAGKIRPSEVKRTAIKPVKDQAPVTIEWDLNPEPAKVQKERARILSEIVKKTEDKKKSQLKMDM